MSQQLPNEIVLRPATAADVPLLLSLIGELADYVHLRDQMDITEQGLHKALFAKHVASALLMEWRGETAGYAIYFYSFSTFTGLSGIYLEDVFVRPAYRGKGIGHAVFTHLARKACEEGCGRMEWECLNWNEPSITFYEKLGAVQKKDSRGYRLSGDALRTAAGL
ncbi:GNAT family N-acetyltransferase [Ethanoligenens sp.]|uniref:GNAT family N-acetyltransferase n=1 Tax=Ethanoligenens sp. TaxID=2099655 RepID=UPI0039EC9271